MQQRIHALMIAVIFILAGCIPSVKVAPTQAPTPVVPTLQSTAEMLPTQFTQNTTIPEQPAATSTSVPPTTVPKTIAGWIAYTGLDYNLYLVNPENGEKRPLTNDARNPSPDSTDPSIQYCCGQWSTDGHYLAYQRSVGQPTGQGYAMQNSLWVYDYQTGKLSAVLENEMTSGFTWKPNSHLISYSLEVPQEYFTSRADHDSSFAKGIWSINVDNGEKLELVAPSRGFSLLGPKWSKDGQLLGFAEVIAMEGSGNFAYYDFTTMQYHAFEQAIGQYAWLPGLNRLAYDRLTYSPSGTEQIWTSDLNGKDEQLFSYQVKEGYAFGPQLSPRDDWLAYLISNPDATMVTLTVQPISGGEGRKLHEFDQISQTAWSPTGDALVVSAGPYDHRQVFAVSTKDGTSKLIAEGGEPAWQPPQFSQ